MATKDFSCKYDILEFDISCEQCHSTKIIETDQGYVCSKCGLVLDIPRMEYHHPYMQEKVQQEIYSGKTRIGFQKERQQNQNSTKMKRLQKIQQSQSNISYVNKSAKIEISRLITGLSLSASLKGPIFKLFKEIRGKLKKGIKYRNPEKLIPVLIYFYCKKEYIAIDEDALLQISKVDKKEYNYCKLKISRFIPHYYERDRMQFILIKVLGVSEHFNLGIAFYYDAKKILLRLWEGIKLTTDNVIAGLVSSIAVLCHYRDQVTINAICNALNIQMSTIQSQVKRKLIERFNILGFKSLVKSTDLIKTTIYNLGTFKEKELKKIKDSEDKKNISNIIEIELLNDEKQIPSLNEEQHIFMLKSFKSNLIYVILNNNEFHQKEESEKQYSKYKKQLKLYKIRYYYPKGPPLIIL